MNFADLNSLQQQALNPARRSERGHGDGELVPVNLNKPCRSRRRGHLGPAAGLQVMARASRPMSDAWCRARTTDPGGHRRRPLALNLQGFYEGHGASLSVNYVWKTTGRSPPTPMQNNVNGALEGGGAGPAGRLGRLPAAVHGQALAPDVDALNITNRPCGRPWATTTAPYSVYHPGCQVLLGLRVSCKPHPPPRRFHLGRPRRRRLLLLFAGRPSW